MTHQKNHTGIKLALEEVISNGVEGLESAVSLLINEAMKVERPQRYQNGWKSISL